MIAVVRWDCDECGRPLVMFMQHVSIIPTDQAAALVTIGEIYSMNGKKDEAKKVRMNILP